MSNDKKTGKIRVSSSRNRDLDLLSEMHAHLEEILQKLTDGDEDLARKLIEGLKYRPLTEQEKFTPKERSDKFLKELAKSP